MAIDVNRLYQFKVIAPNNRIAEPGKLIVSLLATFFFTVCTWTSYARWADFEYRTFDLAYYVQAIWQLIHGRFQVSVENVPLLGNHVEPIVLLFAPFFALFRHPLLFVVVQNAALAAMGPIGYAIAKRLGVDGKRACLLGAALLLTPGAGYIALHEFHPEALVAPLFLLMYHARLTNSSGRHWLWFIGVLACKENMALLLAAYCVVQCFRDRKRGLAELRTWYLWPLGLAVLWFVICSYLITPALNSGNIDYVALYDRLGNSPGNILWNAVTQPHRVGHALAQSLTQGNLVWAFLVSFLFVPLLRPRWILIAAPILLQHLLSWRSSEWMIYFHYGAPLLPLFWIAAVETLASAPTTSLAVNPKIEGAAPSAPNGTRRRVSLQMQYIPWLILLACVAGQIWFGPAASIASSTADWFSHGADRARKNAFVSQIPADASVVAPFPYLTHLAQREKLYSLHYILKGLKTLSRAAYEPPPPTDFVLVDYLDSATFDPSAGYYHPPMKTTDGRIIPSSDWLLHNYLKQTSWTATSSDELTLFKQGQPTAAAPPPGEGKILEFGVHTQLVSMTKSADEFSDSRPWEIQLQWSFRAEREVFPWMVLRLTNDAGAGAVLTKGLCAPEAGTGWASEIWRVTNARELAPGEYSVEAIFFDNTRRAWLEGAGQSAEAAILSGPVPLGRVKVER